MKIEKEIFFLQFSCIVPFSFQPVYIFGYKETFQRAWKLEVVRDIKTICTCRIKQREKETFTSLFTFKGKIIHYFCLDILNFMRRSFADAIEIETLSSPLPFDFTVFDKFSIQFWFLSFHHNFSFTLIHSSSLYTTCIALLILIDTLTLCAIHCILYSKVPQPEEIKDSKL